MALDILNYIRRRHFQIFIYKFEMKASESYLKMDHDFDHKILYFLLTRYAHLKLHKLFSLPQTIFLTANYFPYRK